MITFLDGPAKGQSLQLKRAPLFLRVVHGPDGWDALDLLSDSPRPMESILVYQLQGQPGTMHIHASKGQGGWFVWGQYRLLTQPQPEDKDTRETARWRAWCLANVPPGVTVAGGDS